MFPRLSRLVRFIILTAFVCVMAISVAIIKYTGSYVVPSSIPHHLQAVDSVKSTRTFKQVYEQKEKADMQGSSESDRFLQATSSRMNPHDFLYIHNPSILCQRGTLTFLIYVHSSPANLKQRQAIRQTWGHPRLLRLINATLLFGLGAVLDPHVQGLIDLESSQYADILQEDFLDSYRNLTYKLVSGLKWTSHYCPGLQFFLKSDDDMLLDITSFVQSLFTTVLPAQKSQSRLVVCNLWTRMKVVRDPNSKWYLPKETFPQDYFPPYCSGSAFVLSADLLPVLYQMSLVTTFFWVDDYYVTGLLVKKLQLQHVSWNSVYLFNAEIAEEKLKNDTREHYIFHVKKLQHFSKLWFMLVARHKGLEHYLQPLHISQQNFSLQEETYLFNSHAQRKADRT